jgi:hypothetical protein
MQQVSCIRLKKKHSAIVYIKCIKYQRLSLNILILHSYLIVWISGVKVYISPSKQIPAQ